MSGRKHLKEALNERFVGKYKLKLKLFVHLFIFDFLSSSSNRSSTVEPQHKSPRSAKGKENSTPKSRHTNLSSPKKRTEPASTPVRREFLEPKVPKNNKTGASRRKQMAPVMRDIISLQNSVNPLIPLAPFCRVVREILQDESSSGTMRMTRDCIIALRESSELFLSEMFSDAFRITLNRKQVTLNPRDIQLLMLLRGPGSLYGSK